MRPIRALALLVAGVALAGCAAAHADRPGAVAGRPPTASAATGATTTTPARARAAPDPAGEAVCAGAASWGTGPERAAADPIAPEIFAVRAAVHDRCDRAVFDLNGLGRVGYTARYVPLVQADPSGQAVPVAGGAALQVTIQAADFREAGHQPWRTPWQVGQRLVGGQGTLREVRFAGSFEHVTTFAVGVRGQRPFRVLVLPDAAGHVTRVAVDVAH